MQEIGSSETTREMLYTHFSFNDYIRFGTPRHIPDPKASFLEWFIGFFEAEGCFLKWPNTNKNDGRDRFGIDISQKDNPLINKIRTRLGFGRVVDSTKPKSEEVHSRYYVHDLDNLKRLIYLFNGNLVTDKRREQFRAWLEAFNKRHGTNILFLETRPEPTFNNGWLSGFFEGDSGFTANKEIHTNKAGLQRFKVRMRFYITQDGEEPLFAKLKILFKNKNVLYKLTNGRDKKKYNRYEINATESHQIVVRYLTKYPFLGKRQIVVSRWARVLNYRLKDYPVTKKSIQKLDRLISTFKKAEKIKDS